MIKVTRLNAVTSWSRALNAARRTVGKSALKKEPSDSWKAKMLLAEHSPIRLVEYEWTWEQIPQWVTVHFVRHHIGCEISRVRLCNCASKETREAWTTMLQELKKIDPVLVSKCVPTCVYRGFCPELKCCGYANTHQFHEAVEKYRKTE